MSSRTSTYFAVAIAVGTTVALTGCLSPVGPESADPDPSESAAAGADCTPDTAKIFWNKAMDAGQVNVGAYMLPGTTAEAGSKPELVELDVETQFSGDGLNMLTDFDSSAVEEWETALLEDARQTGQVDREFGEPLVLPETPDSTINSEAPGTGVQVISRPQVSMPYEIHCSGMDIVEGFVIAASNGSLSNTFFLCGDAGLELEKVEAQFAKELCAAE